MKTIWLLEINLGTNLEKKGGGVYFYEIFTHFWSKFLKESSAKNYENESREDVIFSDFRQNNCAFT